MYSSFRLFPYNVCFSLLSGAFFRKNGFVDLAKNIDKAKSKKYFQDVVRII